MAKGSSRPGKESRVRERKGKVETLGYPVLEALIEEENAKLPSFEQSRQALLELSKKAKDPETKTSARHATLAYERFQHFFEEMVKLREKMIREIEQSQEAELATRASGKKARK